VPDGRGKNVLVAFEIVVVAREPPERARNVGGDGRFLGDDQTFGHGAVRVTRGKGRADDKQAQPVGQGALGDSLAQSLVETARKTSNVTGKFQFDQRNAHDIGGQPAAHGQSVDASRIVP
jgi:hypothetical protein